MIAEFFKMRFSFMKRLENPLRPLDRHHLCTYTTRLAGSVHTRNKELSRTPIGKFGIAHLN